jgi:hypothetical protein
LSTRAARVEWVSECASEWVSVGSLWSFLQQRDEISSSLVLTAKQPPIRTCGVFRTKL